MIALTDLEAEILELAIEDYYGLWEVLWLVESESAQTGEAVFDRAKATLEHLLSENLICLFKQAAPTGEMRAFSQAEALELIADPHRWQSAESLFVGATKNGEDWFKRQKPRLSE